MLGPLGPESVWHDWAVMLFDGVTGIFKALQMNWDCRCLGSCCTKDRSLSLGAAYRPTPKPGQYSDFTGTTCSPPSMSTPSTLWKKTATLRASPCPLSLVHCLVYDSAIGSALAPTPRAHTCARKAVYLHSGAEHYGNVLDVHFRFQFLGNNMVHVHNEPGDEKAAALGQLFQQALELLHLLRLRAPATCLLEARQELLGQQVLRQVPQVLLQQTGHRVRLILFQVWRLLSVVRCFQLVHLGFNSWEHSNSEQKKVSRKKKIKHTAFFPSMPTITPGGDGKRANLAC